jgi:ABC transporter substrate binding protein
MRRREFIKLLGGAAAAWPLAARAQQPENVRRIGVLSGAARDNPDLQARLAAFQQVLQQLDWTDGRNVRIDYRWGAGSADNMRKYAAELVALAPARSSNVGLIMTASPLTATHRDLVIALAAQHKLPAVYYNRSFADAGGLISYGPNFIDQYRQAAGYVDRILKGEKPANLPVQAPAKYELVLNLKTAKALGLDVPATLLARADEVIE